MKFDDWVDVEGLTPAERGSMLTVRFRAGGDSAKARFYVYRVVGGKRKLVQ